MLEVRGLEAGYGDVPALFGVDLAVGAGRITALMGRNGMGKTTLLKAIMGLVRIGNGEILLAGRDLVGLPPYRIARQGVAYVPQGREIFTGLTVEENLRLGTLGHPELAPGLPARLFDLFPVLDERRRQRAGLLSGGEQQQLAIARALIARPRLLLLDEPSEGVQPTIVEDIGRALAEIAVDDGIAVLLVEQSLDLALGIAERVLFMEGGRIAAAATPAELDADPMPLDRYLGV
jgi:branched-chain amino acid transport system ATP-binding protein/urea transport system ATP-binding protein